MGKYVGIEKSHKGNRWRARFSHNGKRVNVPGSFGSRRAAAKAMDAARLKLGPPSWASPTKRPKLNFARADWADTLHERKRRTRDRQPEDEPDAHSTRIRLSPPGGIKRLGVKAPVMKPLWEWDSEAAASEAHIKSLLRRQSMAGRKLAVKPNGTGPFIEVAYEGDSPYLLARLAQLDLEKLVNLNRFHLGSALTKEKDCHLKNRTPLFLTSMAQAHFFASMVQAQKAKNDDISSS